MDERFSLVFLLRGRPDAVLDCAALASSSVAVAAEELPVQTVAEFMKSASLLCILF